MGLNVYFWLCFGIAMVSFIASLRFKKIGLGGIAISFAALAFLIFLMIGHYAQ